MNDLDWLAHAIADSYHMTPYRWVAKYGRGYPAYDLTPEHKHLITDYRQTQREMTEALNR